MIHLNVPLVNQVDPRIDTSERVTTRQRICVLRGLFRGARVVYSQGRYTSTQQRATLQQICTGRY